MSIFRCGACDQTIDADYNGGEQHPHDITKCVCDNCYYELLDGDTDGFE